MHATWPPYPSRTPERHLTSPAQSHSNPRPDSTCTVSWCIVYCVASVGYDGELIVSSQIKSEFFATVICVWSLCDSRTRRSGTGDPWPVGIGRDRSQSEKNSNSLQRPRMQAASGLSLQKRGGVAALYGRGRLQKERKWTAPCLGGCFSAYPPSSQREGRCVRGCDRRRASAGSMPSDECRSLTGGRPLCKLSRCEEPCRSHRHSCHDEI